MRRDRERLSGWKETAGGVLVPEREDLPQRTLDRRMFLGTAAAGAATLALPGRANAGPLLYIGGIVLGWAITKVLNSIWDTLTKKEAIRPFIMDRPDPTPTPLGRTTYDQGHGIDAQFGHVKAFAGPDDDSRIYRIPESLIDTLGTYAISPHILFDRWGAPTAEVAWREIDDGYIGGQWYSQIRQRYVVFRLFKSGRDPVYLPCVNDYADRARDVVVHGKLSAAGPRLHDLIAEPSKYKFDAAADTPANPVT